jgi:uncharacterized protein YeaO (DUF488 family)
MKRKLLLHTFRVGAAPKRGEGLRIGAVRWTPRGIPRARWRENCFDVWLPVIAPSASLIRRLRKRDSKDAAAFKKFFEAYEREMHHTGSRQTNELLAALAPRTRIAVGCYCPDERDCHRSRLQRLIRRAARRGRL